jgi:cytochrome c
MLAPALAAALVVSGTIASGTAYADGDAAKGKTLFSKCAICHSVKEGENKVGPSIFGIVGRPSATIPGFSYSEAMKKYNVTWDPATLDAYLVNPRQAVPGTKMIFVGLKEPADRADVIAYLATLK